MHERILLAGTGGQGIMLMGKLLATAALDHVPHLTFFPAYGAEVRGGTSNCQVVFSSEEIASPVCDTFDAMILMNQASADRFIERRADSSSLIILNASLCTVPDTVPTVSVHATALAEELGNVRVANLIMLGAYLAQRTTVPASEVERCIDAFFAGKDTHLLKVNHRALHTGLQRSLRAVS